ncbi:MAG: aminoglycoside phosphotransferase family protein [Flavobacteriales bacterium]|nr:aminoglycoside phosphotransferase family protein [Flavobacteriales bacterium]
MSIDHKGALQTLCDHFGIALNGHDCIPFGSGLINRTYLLKDRNHHDDWILQQVNTTVFTRPELIAYNNYLASEHLRVHHPDYLFMSGKRTTTGKDLFIDNELGAWRVFPFIQNSISYDGAVTPDQAFSAAQQFGRLSRNLDGIYVGAFKTIIVDFHDLGKRYARFTEAINTATPERRSIADSTIRYFVKYAHIVEEFKSAMLDPDVHTRITHNDTKVNNVLFDKDTNEAICVVDLDTLMPGKALFDLGDMIRTFISSAAEDDPDPAHCSINADVFTRLVEGWFSEMAPLLSFSEKALVFWSGQMLMYEQGIRFLTDFLQNDIYYKTTRPEHNLDRAKNQMHLLTAYTARREEFTDRVRHVLK